MTHYYYLKKKYVYSLIIKCPLKWVIFFSFANDRDETGFFWVGLLQLSTCDIFVPAIFRTSIDWPLGIFLSTQELQSSRWEIWKAPWSPIGFGRSLSLSVDRCFATSLWVIPPPPDLALNPFFSGSLLSLHSFRKFLSLRWRCELFLAVHLCGCERSSLKNAPSYPRAYLSRVVLEGT